ncbi:MAG: hypothetical protein LBU88_01540 [Treponema sp.]|jgi:hypothetical protein|nr:hypothetical protein [Treponema sp.]
MQAEESIDFTKIDWKEIDEKKAEFIYNEALEHHKGIIENNNRICDKALGMLSFIMPIMTALAGYLAITWGELSCYILFTASWAGVCLFVITFNLLFIIVPRSINQGVGSPRAYLTDDYYKRNMRELFVGNIINLHNCILQDYIIINKRAWNFRIAVTFCAILPLTSFLAFLLVNYLR